MNTTNRRLHERALELAASAIDFALGRTEAAELAAHLATCPACTRSAAALRTDAAAIHLPAMLPSRRVDDAVYAAIAGPAVRSPRLLVLVAATVLLLVALLGVAAAGALLPRSWQTLPLVVIGPTPSVPPAPTAPPAHQTPPASPSPMPSAGPSPVPASLPVAAGGVQMVPGPDGGVYVLVSSEKPTLDGPPSSSVLALLGADGQARTGWPIALTGWTCDAPGGNASWPPVPADDGSVSIVCHADQASDETVETRAFAFDATGSLIAAWPFGREVWDHQPRIVDGRLVFIDHEFTELESGDYSGAYWLVTVAADGEVRTGTRYEIPADATGGLVALDPDGIGYRTAGNEITAFDIDGVRAGWPIRVDGMLSALAFGPDGRIYLTTSTDAGTSRLLVFDRDGRTVPVGSDQLPIEGASAWSGAGPSGGPLAPLVAPDGTAFVIGEADGRAVVYGIDPSGNVMSGWPYQAATALEWQGSCPADTTGCGFWRAVPSVGQDRVVYLPLAAPDAQIGGSLDVVGSDGRALPGWPMHLARRGAESRSIVGGSDGTVYALAVEPETGGKTSATILAIAKDGTVLSRTTVVAP